MIWNVLMKNLVTQMNEKQLSCTELCNIAYDLNVVKVRSEKMFEFIVVYFEKMQFSATDLKVNI
jgi:glutathionylspermidine synthase